MALAALALLGAWSRQQERLRNPVEVRARIVRLLPAKLPDRAGWANDGHAAFVALDIEPVRHGDSVRFEQSKLYAHVFAIAEEEIDGPLVRALMPRIHLERSKITRKQSLPALHGKNVWLMKWLQLGQYVIGTESALRTGSRARAT